MENATTIALSRLVAQTRAMDVTANNLANAGTPGFRTERMLFSDWLVREPAIADGKLTPSGGRMLSYTQDRATYRDQQEGPLNTTANPLDLALSGNGYFTVLTPQGPRLTRAGHFQLAADGTITDQNGNALLDTAGQPLQLAAGETDPTIAGDGTISSAGGTIGKIAVVIPNDPAELQAEGNALLNAVSGTTPAAAPKVIQGAIEQSNVEPITETTAMMTELREFQFVTQFVEAEGTREQNAIDKLTAPAS